MLLIDIEYVFIIIFTLGRYLSTGCLLATMGIYIGSMILFK